jgi:hypothetical protein
MIDMVIERLSFRRGAAWLEISIRVWRGPLRSTGTNNAAACEGCGLEIKQMRFRRLVPGGGIRATIR